MMLKLALAAATEAERRQLEALLATCSRAVLAGPSWPLPVPFVPHDELLRPLPDAVLLALPTSTSGCSAALAMVHWLRQELGPTAVMVVGPLEPAQGILEAMRAGASEYLEAPLRLEALDGALTRAAARIPAAPAAARGKLIVVLSARGGAGATTLAVNLALALEATRPQGGPPTLLLDAAPLGHATLHLNLKPQFTLRDLCNHAQRLDPALLESLLLHHDSGVALLAGPSEPFAPRADGRHAAWLDLLLDTHPLVVADLSTRSDAIAAGLLESAAHILLVSQTDTVSLWSTAKIRQFFDPGHHRPFGLVLNRFNAQPQPAIDGLEAFTQMPTRCRLPNAYAALRAAAESGQPLAARARSPWARSVHELAAALLGGSSQPPPARSWLSRARGRPAHSSA
ncbi:MAG: AAA family ATPase [Terriglobales bacterium]